MIFRSTKVLCDTVQSNPYGSSEINIVRIKSWASGRVKITWSFKEIEMLLTSDLSCKAALSYV